MILVAMIGLVAAATLKTGALFQRAAKEKELLEIGAQFSDALRSYAAATPRGQPTQPPSLKELLRDPRFPNPRRHLRKIFVDPITGRAEWGVVYLRDKAGVLAVYSLSDAVPLKVANFDLRFQNLEGREKISDWKFVMAGAERINPALLTSPPGAVTGAPSLFGPAPATAAPPPPVRPAEQPPVESLPDEPKAQEPAPEQPKAEAEPAVEEQRDVERDEEVTPPPDDAKGPSTIVTPPPAHRRSR